MGLAQGKRVLVCGARNKWSIGWHCALSLHREGANLAFSVYSDREKDDVQKLLDGAGIQDSPIFQCNAVNEDDVERLYEQVGAHFDGQLDGLVHSIAFAGREELSGEYVTTSRTGFELALSSSAYTLVSLTNGARPLMQAAGGGAVVTLTYLGSIRVIPKYNVMGVAKAALEASMRYLAGDLGGDNIRVNAVSAGAIKTLSAQGISGFGAMLEHVSDKAALHRKVGPDEVGDAVLFLISDLARGITGDILYVDAGYHIMGI